MATLTMSLSRAPGEFADNWELSQARALSVVRFMQRPGFPPDRLAATGFGEYRPVVAATAQRRGRKPADRVETDGTVRKWLLMDEVAFRGISS